MMSFIMTAALSLVIMLLVQVHGYMKHSLISKDSLISTSIHYKSNCLIRCGMSTAATDVRGTFDVQRIKDAGFAEAYYATSETLPYDRPKRRIPKWDAPIIVVPNFLTDEECDEIIRVGSELETQGIVSQLYLNHRLNKEVSSQSTSAEALELIREQNLDEEELAADALSGFRAPLPPSVLLAGEPLTEGKPQGEPVPAPTNSVGAKMLKLLGCEDRKMSFLEDQWINPSASKIMIRDQTTVHYRVGEGVPPHVDGNHATLLLYLNDVEPGHGGRTVFPEAGIASVPRRRTALLYCSKGQKLLHFAEQVKAKEKWVMQVLIDHNFRRGGTGNMV